MFSSLNDHPIHTEMVPRSFANVPEKSWISLTGAARNSSIPREYLLLSVFFPRSHCRKAEKNAVWCFQFLTVPDWIGVDLMLRYLLLTLLWQSRLIIHLTQLPMQKIIERKGITGSIRGLNLLLLNHKKYT